MPRASACSCARFDVREQLDKMDGAFVGSLLSRDEPVAAAGEPVSSGTEVAYHFLVDQPVKGEIAQGPIDVWAAWSGATCGLETPVGYPIGLLLRRDGDRWTSSLCLQTTAYELSRAARPTPPPPPPDDGGGNSSTTTTAPPDVTPTPAPEQPAATAPDVTTTTRRKPTTSTTARPSSPTTAAGAATPAAEATTSTSSTPTAPTAPTPGDSVVAMPEPTGGGGSGRPFLAGSAAAALLAAGLAGLIRRRRPPKLPPL